MRFSEIASRLTGVSSPVFGVSWTPPEAEVTAARRVLSFLEDRRVLYEPTTMGIPDHCISSVIEIRRFLTSEIGHLEYGDELTKNLRAMRAACRKFLDQIQALGDREIYLPSPIGNMGSYSAWVFCGALGEMRGVFGLHVAMIAVRNGLDVESELATILPTEDGEDDEGEPSRRLP